MKTSVVLLALATAALAAPAHHEDTLDVHIPAKFLDSFTRERKSTFEHNSNLNTGTPDQQPSSQISEFGVSGRSFNLKKPIIIKKRVGSTYQVYRDSEEEKLDSPVPCNKQVRVNLCDENNLAKSANMLRSSTVEDLDVHATEDDMKHSILLAKEAVENLQKDLRNIEHEPTKSASWKHGNSESDTELHQDIEVARQALEHIHENFGVMEEATHETMKQAENVEDVAVPLAHTEEERLAQWKDAIENIQRNVELVRNIEESFKSSHDGITHNENVQSTKDINEHELTTKHDMRVTGSEIMKEEHKATIEESKHSKLEKLASEHKEMKSHLAEKDMMESPSTVSISKLQNLNHDDKARLTSESQVKDQHVKVEGALKESHIITPENTHALKFAEEANEKKTGSELLEKTDKLEKNTGLEKSLHEHARDAVKELHDTKMKFNHDEHDKTLTKTETQRINMKSAEHLPIKNVGLNNNEDKTHHLQLKQVNGFTTEDANMNTQAFSDLKTQDIDAHKDQLFIEGKAALNQNTMMHNLNPDTLAIEQHMPIDQTLQMKSPEDTKNTPHHLIDHSHMRWVQDKNFNTEMGLMKSAPDSQVIDHTKHMHSGHHHIHQHAHLDNHGHLRHHEHLMAHGKSADMDSTNSNYYMMRDSDNMGQDGQRFKWRPSHHLHESRTAYGAPAPASAPVGGAVGLFPNANVGSCGIPLLLSCNPSVVSGSLAKAHPAPYSAPSYRTEDNFNFHSKRDVKTENLMNKMNRTPMNTILKTGSL